MSASIAQGVKSECESQMRAGICIAKVPTTKPVLIAGYGSVNPESWNKIVGEIRVTSDIDLSMCHRAEAALTKDPKSAESAVALALWQPKMAALETSFSFQSATRDRTSDLLFGCVSIAFVAITALVLHRLLRIEKFRHLLKHRD